MNETSSGPFGATAEDLDSVERDIAACREELVALRARTRVMEVESSSWKAAPSRRLPERGAFLGFLTGLFSLILVGAVIASVLAR